MKTRKERNQKQVKATKAKRSVFVRNFSRLAVNKLIQNGFEMSENTKERLQKGNIGLGDNDVFINVVDMRIHLINREPALPFIDCGDDVTKLLKTLLV